MKQAFVTGGTRGIGREIALLFAKNGYEVGFCYEKSDREAQELCSQISKYSKGYAFRCNLSEHESVLALGDQICSLFPNLSVLVNNAGVSSYGVFQNITGEEFDRVFSVNFKSMFVLTGKVVEVMLKRNCGSIINLSSIWGQTGASCEVLYSASKAAVIGFTKAVSKELAPSGITVNCIAPGVVDTDMMSSFSEKDLETLKEEIPLGRFASPQEVASLALYLAGDESRFITGQVFGINGGQYC